MDLPSSPLQVGVLGVPKVGQIAESQLSDCLLELDLKQHRNIYFLLVLNYT